MCAARDKKPGFDSEFTGTVLKIKLRGEIDHHSALVLREEADSLIYRFRPQEVAIDLSTIEFMDSSGLGLLLGRYQRSEHQDPEDPVEERTGPPRGT